MTQGIIVAIFGSRRSLTRALDHLIENKIVTIKHAAVVAKARNGETIILDDDLSPNEGGIVGGTLGAATSALGMLQLGALALPGVGPIIALGAGALVGGLLGNLTGRFAANLLDFGYHNEQIERFSLQLKVGHPALVLEIDDVEAGLPILQATLKPFRAELIEPLHKASLKPPPETL